MCTCVFFLDLMILLCVFCFCTCGPMPPMPRGGFILIGPPMFGCPAVKRDEKTTQRASLVSMPALFTDRTTVRKKRRVCKRVCRSGQEATMAAKSSKHKLLYHSDSPNQMRLLSTALWILCIQHRPQASSCRAPYKYIFTAGKCENAISPVLCSCVQAYTGLFVPTLRSGGVQAVWQERL